MNKHRVLFVVESRIVLTAMLPAMLEIRESNTAIIDVYVFDFGESHAYYRLFEEAAAFIMSLGFIVTRTMPQNKKYDVVYSAYPGEHTELMQWNEIKYFVRFRYGLTGANVPYASYSPNIYNFYDFVLCLGEPDATILSGHIKTFSIGNIKLANYKRSRITPDSKKTVLYLPTWGAKNRANSINIGTVEKLVKLQDNYTIVAKMHNATMFFDDQNEHREIFDLLDHNYDTNIPIADLLNEADVVLSDLSGAAFDAIAGDVPLALFGLGDSIYYGGKLCLHQQLVKDDIVPGTNDINQLESVIEKALTPEYFSKQQKLKKEMFPYEGRECVEAFMRFQNDLFEDRIDPWYIATRRALREDFLNSQERAAAMQQDYAEAVEHVRHEYETSNSWKLTKPLRAITKLVKREKEN